MNISISTFCVKVTPSFNIPICGFGPPANEIESDIYLRGIVFNVNGDRYLISVIEFCVITGSFYYELLKILASHFETPFENVTLHTSHQHDVPAFDELGHKTAEKYNLSGYKSSYWSEVVSKIKEGLSEFKKIQFKEIKYYSNNASDVHEYASDRRIIHEGKLFWRHTKCQDPFIKSLPEGDFDPALSLIAFYDVNKNAIATMSFYASHPQVANGRLKISSDAPGVALRKLSEKIPGALHLYFDGCGGDIGNGKWASSNIEVDLEVFGDKLFQAMSNCYDARDYREIKSFKWSLHQFQMPTRKFDDNVNELREAILKNRTSENLAKSVRLLGYLEKEIESYPFRYVHLKFGDSNLVFLPSEMFCEYQKFIKKILKDEAACIAAYGDCFFCYIPEDHDFELGGFEVNGSFRVVEKGCEAFIKNKLSESLLY